MAAREGSPLRRRGEGVDRRDERGDRADRSERQRSRGDDDDYDSRSDHRDRDRRRDRDRDRDRRRRRRRSSSSSERSMGMSNWKLGMVIGVIVVCFAMLYPKMFHPMLMGLLGMNPPPQPASDQPFAPGPIHPSMAGRGRGEGSMHPGMRMAAAQAGHASEKGSSGGKGMWSWMLPCYTVGVIVFLLYTLSKIMFKPSRNKRSRKYDMRYNSARERFEVDGPNYSDEESESDDDVPAAGGKMNKGQLRGLQRKLRDTESAMSKILEQLEQVSHATDPNVAEAAKQMTMDTLNQLSQIETNTSRGGRSRGRKDDDLGANSDQYLQDLERALSEFKNLSEAYAETAVEQKKVQGKGKKSSETTKCKDGHDHADGGSQSEDEEKNSRGSDDDGEDEGKPHISDSEEEGHPLEPMESEDLDNLTVPEGEGEIIDLNASGPSVSSTVRKRH